MIHTKTTGRFELTAVQPGAATIRRIFALFPSGVAALSASTGTGTSVLLASSFQVGISADPPLVLVAAQHTSVSWPKLRACPRIGVSVLSHEHQDIVGQLSSKSGDKLAGIPSETTHSGAHFITGAVMSLECSIYAEIPAGDHDVILLQVHAVAAQPDMSPLIWFGSTFHTLSSPHPVPESPTVRGQVNFLRTSEHG